MSGQPAFDDCGSLDLRFRRLMLLCCCGHRLSDNTHLPQSQKRQQADQACLQHNQIDSPGVHRECRGRTADQQGEEQRGGAKCPSVYPHDLSSLLRERERNPRASAPLSIRPV